MASQQVVANGHSKPKQPSHDPAASISVTDFKWQSADHKLQAQPGSTVTAAPPSSAPLGVLSNFHGNFSGNGLNMIFRPNSGPPNGTTFPNPVTPAPPTAPSENVLEINLTAETLNFGAPLGSVPNRGLGLVGQDDVFLNGVPYVQTVNDVASVDGSGKADGPPIGIHFETGIWMHLPATTSDPVVPASLVRMGSIPHGTTINAQAVEPTHTFNGPPVIPTVDITPFVIGAPTIPITFAAQTATNTSSPRLPQDLSAFIKAGTITQEILTDPNTVLRNANVGKTIIKTEVFTVSTSPASPELGGGTANIAFLVGTAGAGKNQGPNANAVSMTATFWINTVQSTITVPAVPAPGTASAIVIQGQPPHPGARVPSFAVQPQVTEKIVTVTHTEIQYSQLVNLNFAGLTWPHVSVATLVPTAHQPVPLHA